MSKRRGRQQVSQADFNGGWLTGRQVFQVQESSQWNALQYALNLVKKDSSAQLHVISVQPPILSGNVKRFISAETIDDYYNEEGEKALMEARKMLDQSGVAASVSVQVGPIAETVVEYAESSQTGASATRTRTNLDERPRQACGSTRDYMNWVKANYTKRDAPASTSGTNRSFLTSKNSFPHM